MFDIYSITVYNLQLLNKFCYSNTTVVISEQILKNPPDSLVEMSLYMIMRG